MTVINLVLLRMRRDIIIGLWRAWGSAWRRAGAAKEKISQGRFRSTNNQAPNIPLATAIVGNQSRSFDVFNHARGRNRKSFLDRCDECFLAQRSEQLKQSGIHPLRVHHWESEVVG
jgi:hypothetical protein